MRNPSYELPIQANPAEREPIKRRHTARYYAHRVRESLATRVSKLACTIFLGLLFLIAIITFILWLSLRPHRPRFHIRDFSIPSLSQPNGFENVKIHFNVTARNSNQNIGIFYDAMQVTLFYDQSAIGNTSLTSPFYQEPKNTKVLNGDLISGATLTITNQQFLQFLADAAQGRVIFRLELTSTIRFKISSWDSKRHRIHANCPAGVGPEGSILVEFKDKRCPVYFS